MERRGQKDLSILGTLLSVAGIALMLENPANNAKLLVVDDNAVNRKVLRNLLKETRIQVTDAESGKECLKLIR